jgi:hypothetical protein
VSYTIERLSSDGDAWLILAHRQTPTRSPSSPRAVLTDWLGEQDLPLQGAYRVIGHNDGFDSLHLYEVSEHREMRVERVERSRLEQAEEDEEEVPA